MDTFLKIILSIPVPKRQTISHWRRGKSTRPDMQVSEQIKKAEPMKQKFLMHYTPHKWPSNPDDFSIKTSTALHKTPHNEQGAYGESLRTKE